MHYSWRPFDLLTVTIGGRVKEQPRWNSLAVERGCSNILAASSDAFTLCDPVTLTLYSLVVRYDAFTLCDPVTLYSLVVRYDAFTLCDPVTLTLYSLVVRYSDGPSLCKVWQF